MTNQNQNAGRPRGIPKGRALLPGLRMMRVLRRMSREELRAQLRARNIHVSASALASWEREESSVPVLYIREICAVLDASEANLLDVPLQRRVGT